MVGGGRRTPVITVLLPSGTGKAGSTCRLDDDEAHHLRVRRAETGEVVAIRDGAGLVGRGKLARGRVVVGRDRVDRGSRAAARAGDGRGGWGP